MRWACSLNYFVHHEKVDSDCLRGSRTLRKCGFSSGQTYVDNHHNNKKVDAYEVENHDHEDAHEAYKAVLRKCINKNRPASDVGRFLFSGIVFRLCYCTDRILNSVRRFCWCSFSLQFTPSVQPFTISDSPYPRATSRVAATPRDTR